MGQRLGIIAGAIVEAAGIGLRFASRGYAVRIFTGEPDPERFLEHLATRRTDVAIIAAEGVSEREAMARECLREWGGATLAGEVPGVPEGWPEPAAPFDPGPAPGSPAGALVLAGSCLPEARAQVDRLADEGALVLTLPREAVLNLDETYLMGIRSGAAAAIRQGRIVVVRSENWPEAAVITRRLGARRGIPAEEIDQRIVAMLARVGHDVVQTTSARRLVAVGTETSAALCRQLGITELIVGKELAPGVPALLVPGPGPEPPLLLVLKAGSTGGPDTLLPVVASR